MCVFRPMDQELPVVDDELMERCSMEFVEMFAELTPDQHMQQQLQALDLPATPGDGFESTYEPLPRLARTSQFVALPSKEDMLASVVASLKHSAPITMEAAFEVLQAVRRKDAAVLSKLPMRSTASPLLPSLGMSYIVCRQRRHGAASTMANADVATTDHSDSSSSSSHSSNEAIAVSFQSIVNSDIWWSPSGNGEGVASRPMSRTRREPGGKGKRDHGYRGRMYTLIERAPGEEGELPAKRQRHTACQAARASE